MGSELCFRPLCLLCCHLNIDVKIQTSVVNLSLDRDWTDSLSLTSLPPRRPWLLRSFLLPPLSSISSHPLFPIMTFAHIFPAVPDCSRVSFVCFLPLSLTSLCFPTSSLFHPSSFLAFFFGGDCHVCVRAGPSRDVHRINLCSSCAFPRSSLCFPHFAVCVCVWSSRESPSLDTVSESLRIQVYHWEDACVCRGTANVGVCRNLNSWLTTAHLI